MISNRDKDFMSNHGLITWGDYNHPPEPFEQVDPTTMHGFYNTLGSYGVKDIEYRQVYLDKKYVEGVHLFIYPHVIYMYKTDRIKIEGKFEWHDIPTVYLVGCKHEFLEKAHPNFKSVSTTTCIKCGYTYTYDHGD